MSASLEDEKKALLERMHASRSAYRSQFGHADEDHDANDAHAHPFPRSHTFRFLSRLIFKLKKNPNRKSHREGER